MTFRYSFMLKLVGALLLVVLADLLFWFQSAGSTVGLFAIAMLVVVGCMRTEIFRRWPARIAFASALFFALALAANPGPLPLLLYWTALTLAALLPRTARFDDGWRWLARLLAHGVLSIFGPVRDHLIASRARRRRSPVALRGKIFMLVMPAVGSTIFLSLFAQANPLIGDTLSRIDFWPEFDIFTFLRAIFWVAVLTAVWSLLRPPRFVLGAMRRGEFEHIALPGVSTASVAISLLAFNLIFALQNGLDLAFLWSGAELPDGMTLAEYAHRGAYPLIATALLAGLFVIVTLRPGAPTAASRPIRILVTFWIAQNLLLVASTMLRTFDYVLAYSLTELRIAALIWMALVALGLALICYRLLRGKSGAWLINANLLAAALVLAACTWVDLGAVAARWNVRHAREVGGVGAGIDLCYLNRLGPSALLPMIELESQRLPDELRERLQWVRSRTMDRLAENQADWHGWIWRDAGRLADAQALAAQLRLPHHAPDYRQCDGRPFPPAPARDEPTDDQTPGNAADPATVGAAPINAATVATTAPPVPPPPPRQAKPLTARPAR